MSRHRRYRSSSAAKRSRRAVFDTVKMLLIIFLSISLFFQLFSVRHSGRDPTEPSVDLELPVIDPTEPTVDSESPVEVVLSDNVDFIGFDITDTQDGDWSTWDQWFE